jgi:hypothetical protein
MASSYFWQGVADAVVVIGLFLFILIFILMAPGSQAFLGASMTGASKWMVSWAPFSFLLLAILLVAPVAAIYLIKTWPVHVEPENPMAKYRREVIDEE